MASQAKIKTQTYLEYIGHDGKRVPPGHWKNIENHKKYIEWLKQKLGYTTWKIGIKLLVRI